MVHHIMGFRPELDGLTVRPRLITGAETVSTRFTIRGATVDVEIRRGSAPKAVVDGKVVPVMDGTLSIPYPKKGSIMRITMDV
jgi:cellobiose phosphorylase